MLATLLAAAMVSASGCPDAAGDPLPGVASAVAAGLESSAVKHDPSLDVRIASVRDLRYDAGADAAIDRPGFVRAGSGATIVNGVLYIAQDDANFFGTVDLETGAVGSIALPVGEGGKRLFDDGRGTKLFKTDLEAIVALPDGSVLGIGSGALAKRMRGIHWRPATEPREIDATAFYESLAKETSFAGSQLNLEGAVAFQRDGKTWLRLFQRGNGAKVDGVAAIDASAEVPLDDFLAGRATTVRNIREYDLGGADGIRLTFSDATNTPDGSTAFVASAEDSPSATEDGRLAGVVIGAIDATTGVARYGRILEADGTPSTRKLEGLAWDATRGQWLAIEDTDDPNVPSRLLVLSPMK